MGTANCQPINNPDLVQCDCKEVYQGSDEFKGQNQVLWINVTIATDPLLQSAAGPLNNAKVATTYFYIEAYFTEGRAFYCNRSPLSAFQKRSDLFVVAKASSEINFLKILPLGLLGIESTKQTPPARCLYPISSVAMYSLTVSSESDWQFRTTKAFGASASLCLTPMTAASTIFG